MIFFIKYFSAYYIDKFDDERNIEKISGIEYIRNLDNIREKLNNPDRIETRNIRWIFDLFPTPSIIDLRIIILQFLSILPYELGQKVIKI